MKQAWNTLLARLDARTVRERALLLGALAALLIFVTDSLFIAPAQRSWRSDSARLAEARTQLATLDAQQAMLQAELELDPDAAVKARIAALQREASATGVRLQEASARFISATEMTRVLRALVSQTGGLNLHGLRSLPAQPVLERPAAADTEAAPADAGPGIWRRGVELDLRGEYAALLAYLGAIEVLPWTLGWELLSIAGDADGQARFTLRLYTLSLDEEWIGV